MNDMPFQVTRYKQGKQQATDEEERETSFKKRERNQLQMGQTPGYPITDSFVRSLTDSRRRGRSLEDRAYSYS
jgi:hypothetical protein